MVTFLLGDLLNSKCKYLVCTVNCFGVMGAGIALQFKEAYPDMFKQYVVACKNQQVAIGKLWCWHEPENLFEASHSVLCFPTKYHWINPSKLEWIALGLQTFVELYKKMNINSIAFPKLGCKNGKLDWETQVKTLMLKYLEPLTDIEIEIYE